MEREDKKYEVLPGVKTPDIKTILDAASDFTNPGVDNVAIKGGDFRKTLAPEEKVAAPSAADIEQLQNLGAEVSEAEKRASEESRKRMEEIKKQVMAPETIKDLKKVAASKEVSEEKREQLNKERSELEAKQAEEEEKNKAREERKLAQQKILEEMEQKKAAAEEKERKRREEAEAAKKQQEEQKRVKLEEELRKKKEANPEADKDAEYLAWVKAKKEAAVAEAESKKKKDKNGKSSLRPGAQTEPKKAEASSSDYQTLDDFSEFL